MMLITLLVGGLLFLNSIWSFYLKFDKFRTLPDQKSFNSDSTLVDPESAESAKYFSFKSVKDSFNQMVDYGRKSKIKYKIYKSRNDDSALLNLLQRGIEKRSIRDVEEILKRNDFEPHISERKVQSLLGKDYFNPKYNSLVSIIHQKNAQMLESKIRNGMYSEAKELVSAGLAFPKDKLKEVVELAEERDKDLGSYLAKYSSLLESSDSNSAMFYEYLQNNQQQEANELIGFGNLVLDITHPSLIENAILYGRTDVAAKIVNHLLSLEPPPVEAMKKALRLLKSEDSSELYLKLKKSLNELNINTEKVIKRKDVSDDYLQLTREGKSADLEKLIRENGDSLMDAHIFAALQIDPILSLSASPNYKFIQRALRISKLIPEINSLVIAKAFFRNGRNGFSQNCDLIINSSRFPALTDSEFKELAGSDFPIINYIALLNRLRIKNTEILYDAVNEGNKRKAEYLLYSGISFSNERSAVSEGGKSLGYKYLDPLKELAKSKGFNNLATTIAIYPKVALATPFQRRALFKKYLSTNKRQAVLAMIKFSLHTLKDDSILADALKYSNQLETAENKALINSIKKLLQ